MIKILHAADFHLDSPITGRTEAQAQALKAALLTVPGKIAQLARSEKCDLVLLAGDLFDGIATPESIHALRSALAEMAVPVFIAPGNHDFCAPDSPWLTQKWPENVHIFTQNSIESVSIPNLNCRVYGAAFRGMDCPALLKGFRTEGEEAYHVAVLHGDPSQVGSPYNPITTPQVRASGLHYLALGHIHKGGAFRAAGTLCAWPGCTMGRGFDELEAKGVLIVEIDESAQARFVPLDTPCFYDLSVDAGEDPLDALAELLPAAGSEDYYRVTLTGPSDPIDLAAALAAFPCLPNLELRDRTVPLRDPWEACGEDSLEGMIFRNLKAGLDGADEDAQRQIQLAARITRRILDGQEVRLP